MKKSIKFMLRPLGDLCEVTGGNSAPQGESHFRDGTVPFVRMRDLGRYHHTTSLLETRDAVNEEAISNNRLKIFEPGCILFPRSGSVALNHRAILAVRACIVSHIGILHRFSSEIDVRYLYWAFVQYDMRAIAKQTTGLDLVGFSDIKKVAIPVPPTMDDQRRIVAEIEKQFTRLDTGVAALRRVQANLKRYRAAVLKAACEGRLVPTEAELARNKALCAGSIRIGDFDSPSHGSNPRAIKQSSISRDGAEPSRVGGSNPPEFTVEPVSTPGVRQTGRNHRDAKVPSSNVFAGQARNEGSTPSAHISAAEFESGAKLLERILIERRQNWNGRGSYKDPIGPDTKKLGALPAGWVWATVEQLTMLVTSGSRGWGDFYSDAGPLFIRAQDIKTDSLNLAGVARVTLPVNAEGMRSSVENNDLLVTITGANVTKSAIIHGLSETAFVSQHVALLKPVCLQTSSFHFLWVVSPAHGRKLLEQWAYGAGKPGLSLEQVRSLPVALPPLPEQTRIVAEVERRLSVVEELEMLVQTNLQRSARLRQSVLQQAFSGKIISSPSSTRARLSHREADSPFSQ